MNYIDKVRGLFVCPDSESSLASIIQSSYNIKYKDRCKYMFDNLPFGYIESCNGSYDNYKPYFKDRDDMCNSFLLENIAYIANDDRFDKKRLFHNNIALSIFASVNLYNMVYEPRRTYNSIFIRGGRFVRMFYSKTIKMGDMYVTKTTHRNGNIYDVSSSPSREHSRLISLVKTLNGTGC